MAEKRKFTALAELSRQQSGPAEIVGASEATSRPEPPTVEPEVAGRSRGRPATGKRSNPDYKLYAHYLKKRTHRQVAAKLAAIHAEDDQQPDLSDLVQRLLEDWLARQDA
jgi:hypothetical protein